MTSVTFKHSPDPRSVLDDATDVWTVDSALRPHASLTTSEVELIERLAFRFGSAPESYEIANSDELFLMTPCQRGVVNVIVDGNIWHIPGGILAPPDLRPQIIEWLKHITEKHGKTLAVYSIGAEDVVAFRNSGYEVSRFGMEPFVDLKDLTWSGSRFQWVRRQANFCTRAGLVVREVVTSEEQCQLAPALLAIMRDDLSGRTYSEPLRLLEAVFDPENLQQRRLFVAMTDDEIQAFVACTPMHNGTGWAFETYRKATDSVRGVVPFLLKTVMDSMQSEGVSRVSLCLVPGKNLDERIPNDSALVNRLLSLWYRRMNFLFNVQGLDHFKQRFRPEEKSRYVCVTPKSTLRSVISFARVTGALRPNIANLAGALFRSITHRN